MKEGTISLKSLHEESKGKFDFHTKEAQIHKEQYEHHLSQANIWKKIMDVSADNGFYHSITANVKVYGGGSFNFETSNKNNTSFASQMEEILLKLDTPMLTRSLMDIYNDRSSKKVSRKDFASKMSIAASKTRMRIIKFDKNPNDSKHWWAIDTWLDNKKNLKPEYFEKIKDRVKS